MKEFIAGLVLTLVIGGIGIAIEMFLAGVACGVELLALVKKSK